MSNKNTPNDPLLLFFHELLDSEQEKEIISMILKDHSSEDIIENLIDFKSEEKND